MVNESKGRKAALICGSVAYDTILVFPDRFKAHLLPDKLHMLHVSFLVPEMRREFGGCAANIAYGVKLLGDEGLAMATAGQDFEPYRARLLSKGVPVDYITVVDGAFTAQAFITSDLDDNQINSFHPGAMQYAHTNRVADAAATAAAAGIRVALGIIAPDGRQAMIEHAAQFEAAGIPFIFDPGQQLPQFGAAELAVFIEQASWVAVNDYEWGMLQQKTGMSVADVVAKVDALIVTRGAEGSTIHTREHTLTIPVVKPAAVVDPTGCGDAYRAGLIHGLMHGLDWETTGRIASLMGSIKIASRGPQNHEFTTGSEFDSRYQDPFWSREFMSRSFSFTSESVSEGHPDKVADQISDAVLDAILTVDPRGRVACETLVKTGVVIVAGEVTTSAWVDVEALVRKTVLDIGYDTSEMGFDGASCGVLNIIGKQSPDIAQGVDRKDERKQGAGDQGLMFGYATNETDVLMPAAITLAHRLVKRQAQVRKNGKLPWLRPDAKSQVTLRYENEKPVGLEAVVLSTQHSDDVSTKHLREAVMEEILKPVLPAKWIDKRTKYHINPTGRFVIGGPVGDCGLTGRKIIVDTYGGFARHGGGAFSGKDPSKVDRSAAYAARYVAKNIVAAGLAERCEVQVSYAIGVADPTSIMVETFGTGKMSDERLTQLVRAHFDLTPYGLREMLDLARPIYQKTAAYGHFGRKEAEFSWERTDKADALAAELKSTRAA